MAHPSRKATRPSYHDSVFINCPFDEQYLPLFRALIFTIQDCGFAARCALEVEDSGEIRATKVIRLIKESQFGIHDICRTELNEGNLPRFNMPYELGIFVGLKYSRDRRQRQKKLLILDKEKFRYQAFLSDIAGQDIRNHQQSDDLLMQEVRHFLQNQTHHSLPGVRRLRSRFAAFLAEIPILLEQMKKSEEDLKNYRDFHHLVSNWIHVNADL